MARGRFVGRFTELERQALLEAIGACRQACLTGSTHSLFDRTDVHAVCDAIKNEIDNLAELLTGDRQYFWGNAHSSSHYSGPATGDGS